MPDNNQHSLANAWDAGYNTGIRRGVAMNNPSIADCVFQAVGQVTVGAAVGFATALAVGSIVKALSSD